MTASAIFAAIPFACAVVVLAMRARAPLPAGSVYRIHWDPLAIAGVFVRECVGALPLTYAAFDPGSFLPPLLALWSALGVPGLIVTALAAVLAFALLGQNHAPQDRGFAALFGVLLATLPAALISLSARQQHEIVWGLAYTPVYMQYFGVALVLALLADALARRALPTRLVVAAALAFIVGTTYAANRLTLAHFADYYGTKVLPSALDAGLLSDAADGAELYVDDSYPANLQTNVGPWNVKYFYYYHTGKRFSLRPLTQLEEPSGTTPRYALIGAVEEGARGVAAAGAVRGVVRDSAGGPVPLVDRATVYASEDGGAGLQTFRSPCGLVSLASLLTESPSGAILGYGDGFFPEERAGGARWRWTGRSSQLTLENPTARARIVRLSFTLRPARAAPARASVGWPAGAAQYELRGQDVPLAHTLTLGPHARVTIPLALSGQPYRPRNDPRTLLFAIRDALVAEAACGPSRTAKRNGSPADRRAAE